MRYIFSSQFFLRAFWELDHAFIFNPTMPLGTRPYFEEPDCAFLGPVWLKNMARFQQKAWSGSIKAWSGSYNEAIFDLLPKRTKIC